VLEPQIWGAATDIYSLVSHFRMSEKNSIWAENIRMVGSNFRLWSSAFAIEYWSF